MSYYRPLQKTLKWCHKVAAPRHGYGKCFHFVQKGWWHKGAVEVLKERNCFAIEF